MAGFNGWVWFAGFGFVFFGFMVEYTFFSKTEIFVYKANVIR